MKSNYLKTLTRNIITRMGNTLANTMLPENYARIKSIQPSSATSYLGLLTSIYTLKLGYIATSGSLIDNSCLHYLTCLSFLKPKQATQIQSIKNHAIYVSNLKATEWRLQVLASPHLSFTFQEFLTSYQ